MERGRRERWERRPEVAAVGSGGDSLELEEEAEYRGGRNRGFRSDRGKACDSPEKEAGSGGGDTRGINPRLTGGVGESERGEDPIMMDTAVDFVAKVEETFKNEVHIFSLFLDILTSSQKSYLEMSREIAILFRDHDTLFQEFIKFMPNPIDAEEQHRLLKRRANGSEQQAPNTLDSKEDSIPILNVLHNSEEQAVVLQEVEEGAEVRPIEGAILQEAEEAAEVHDDRYDYFCSRCRLKKAKMEEIFHTPAKDRPYIYEILCSHCNNRWRTEPGTLC